ncbi:MAG: hypothetical protein EZS28_033736 [Streblomastix strix]|uniref:Uncharacterized protein n=1 Tax=Streblomastix strix TaxID=222440 RepID=A0A5J4UJJ2_9EUKA|nr:MAG: hypothetical protein EZS28_033736 [Streblomastix strix]
MQQAIANGIIFLVYGLRHFVHLGCSSTRSLSRSPARQSQPPRSLPQALASFLCSLKKLLNHVSKLRLLDCGRDRFPCSEL